MKRSILFLLAMLFYSSAFSSDLPLIYSNNLEYVGAFTTPATDTMSYGGSSIVYNPTNSSLFIVASDNNVAEISIPTPVNSTVIGDLNRATYIQTESNITEGNVLNITAGGAPLTGSVAKIGGLLINGTKLVGTSYAYYSSSAVLSHFTSDMTLTTTGDFAGMYAVGSYPEVPTASYVSGWMTQIPTALQSELGGPAITGNGNLSIIGRTSHGPSAFVFDPNDLGVTDPVPAEALFYYPDNTLTVGGAGESGYENKYWNTTTKMAGVAIPEGSRSMLFFGYHGIGEYNYGQPASDPIYAYECRDPDTCTTGPKGWQICSDSTPANCTTGRKGIPYDAECAGSGGDGCYFDPTGMGSKGPHAYPYIYQVWAYDINDMVDVRNGVIAPNAVMPYAIWSLPLEVTPTSVFGGATAYDPVAQLLYVVAPNAELNGCCKKLPIIHVFHVNLSAGVSTYNVTGQAILLGATLQLVLNDTETISVVGSDQTVPDKITFTTELSFGDSYSVKIKEQPVGYSCKLYNNTGIIDAKNDIENLVAFCNQHQFAPPAPTNFRVIQ